MGQNRRAHLVFEAAKGGSESNTASTTFNHMFSPASVDTWAAFVDTLSKATLTVKTRVIEEYLDVEPTIDSASDNDLLAICVFRNVDTGLTLKISIPSPIDAMITSTPNGQRVSNTYLQSIANQININSTLNVVPSYGYIIRREP